MEHKTGNQPNLLNFQINFIEAAINNESKSTQNQLNQSADNQLLNHQQLRAKSSILLSSANDSEKERNFRRTCVLNQENSNSSPELNEAYQEYVKSYHKITSIYLIDWMEETPSNESYRIDDEVFLLIYDTENDTKKWIRLEALEPLHYNSTSVAQLPNGELFCFGNHSFSGVTCIIDKDYEVRRLPSGKHCKNSSAIYFNRSVYCFGGNNQSRKPLGLSVRFDLDRNRWIKLAPMPKAGKWCYSVIFNGNILISGFGSKNLLLYSIDIDSFSKIFYKFDLYRQKIMVNAEERLYLFAYRDCCNIYESKIRDEYAWECIGVKYIHGIPGRLYCTYNKGAVYIGYFSEGLKGIRSNFYKFRLKSKKLKLI